MSNPYLAVLATPPGRERFGFVPATGLMVMSASVAAALNEYAEPADLSVKEASEMIKAGQATKPFANQERGSGLSFKPGLFGLTQKHFGAARSVGDASVKAAYLLGVLSRYTLDRRYADKGAQLINAFIASPMSVEAMKKERDPAKIAELYAGVLREIEPTLKGRESDPGVKFLLKLLGRQGESDAVRSVQAQEEERKAGAFELFDPNARARQDSCFETPEARESHTKWEAMVPAFLREPDPKATPPGCKTRLKPWVMPTGIGVSVGLVALLLFRRRRPQQTVVMIPSIPAPAPANR